MGVVFTDGAVRAIRGAASGDPAFAPPINDVLWSRGANATFYKGNPSVRTAVDLIARNIAQLGLHLYERRADESRERDRTAGPARLMAKPSAWCSSYRLMYMTVVDLGVYGEAIWWKEGAAGARTALHRVNPHQLTYARTGEFVWALPGFAARRVDPANFIRIWTFDPENEYQPCSLLETLRWTIAEDRAAGQHRMNLWRSGAALGGVIERPKSAGTWSDEARARLRRQWTEAHSGARGAGSVPVLEDDMKFKETSWSPAEAQSYETRKANAEEITRSHQIPLPSAGILDHGTSYASVREMHKQLYQDCLGPVLTQIEAELALQLLDEYGLFDSHYFEFNINEKLKGSFEETSASLSRSVGGPYMTPNEARARLNMPALDDGDRLYPQPGSGTGNVRNPIGPDDAGPGRPDSPEAEPAVH